MRVKGRVSEWHDHKGFGFVTSEESQKRAFVHISAFRHLPRRPSVNDVVYFEMSTDHRGRLRAENAEIVFSKSKHNFSKWVRFALVLAACAFLSALAASVSFGRMPRIVFFSYLVFSFIAFFAYWLDKSASVEGRWRTQESTLQFFSLIGGWPGALIAQQLLRHKSRKRSFQAGFWFAVSINIAMLAWLSSPQGAILLAHLFAM